MSTGDKLALGAVAALAAIGIAKQRRKGSQSKLLRAVYKSQGMSEAEIDRKLGITKATTQSPKTRKRVARKQPAVTARKQPVVTARKKSVVTAKQQTMISQVLKKMGKLTADEKKTYTAKLSALTEDQVRQLKRQCDQEAA